MTRTTFFILGFLCVATGCSSSRYATRYDYDPNADFNALQTYAWAPGEVVGDVSQFTVERVRNITNDTLAEKGYREGVNPDFVVQMHGGRTAVHSAGWGWSGMEFRTTDRAALVIHIQNASTQRTIWSGAVLGEAEPNATPERQTERLTEAIGQLLASFPPK